MNTQIAREETGKVYIFSSAAPARTCLRFGAQEILLSAAEARILLFLALCPDEHLAPSRLIRRVYGAMVSRDPIWQLEQDMEHLRRRLASTMGRDPIQQDAECGYRIADDFEFVIDDVLI